MKRIIYGLLLSLACMHAAYADRMTEPYPDLISLTFANDDGSGVLEWGFGGPGYFFSYVDAGQYELASVGTTFDEFEILIVPEPPALALFALAFLAAAKRRHTWHRLTTCESCSSSNGRDDASRVVSGARRCA